MALHERGRPREVRRRADRRRRRGDRARREPRDVQARSSPTIGAESRPLGRSATRWTSASPRSTTSATRSSCGPSFTMGGAGSGIAYDEADLRRIAGAGLQASPTTEVLLEESIIGWKEYELELMRDRNDNVVVVCSIENLDPMGVHTGDSITVAPALTLTDREYQRMRDVGIAIIRAVGVDTGGCNIQFAVNPADGRHDRHRDEPARLALLARWRRRPPASRSPRSPRKLAIGYTLDEIPNDITARDAGVASSRPSTTSWSRCRGSPSRSSRSADPTLTTTMKSVGEAMAIGRNFTEALQKALRSLEKHEARLLDWHRRAAPTSTSTRCWPPCARARTTAGSSQVQRALWAGAEHRAGARGHRHRPVVPRPDLPDQRGRRRGRAPPSSRPPTLLRAAKRHGFSDRQIGALRGAARGRRARRAPRARRAAGLQDRRHLRGRVRGARRRTTTPPTTRRPRSSPREPRQGASSWARGPNRIGQGIEFDYSCVHAALTLREAGYETVMVNCNPETVSTDYDTRDRLYFEPLTLEDVLEVVHAEQRRPARSPASSSSSAARPRSAWRRRSRTPACPIVGTSPEAIDLAEERGAFGRVLAEAGLPAPEARHGHARFDEAAAIAARDRLPGARAAVATCSAGAAWRSSTTTTMLRDYLDARHRHQPRAPGAGRPLPRRRHRDRRRRALRRHRAVPRRRHGAHRGGRHPLRRLRVRAAADHARARATSSGSARSTEAIAARRRRARPAQRPVRPGRRRALRARGQPARLAHRAVRVQGDRRAAGQGRGPGDARARPSPSCAPRGCCRRRATAARCRSDAPIAVKEAVLPFGRFHGRRHGARPGDALDRRGHGHRRTPSASPSPSRRTAAYAGGLPTVGHACSCRSPTATSASMIFPVKRLADLGFRDPGHRRAPPRCCAATASRRRCVRKQHEGRGPNGEPTTVDAIMAGDDRPDRQHPVRRRARGSTATRSAPPR